MSRLNTPLPPGIGAHPTRNLRVSFSFDPAVPDGDEQLPDDLGLAFPALVCVGRYKELGHKSLLYRMTYTGRLSMSQDDLLDRYYASTSGFSWAIEPVRAAHAWPPKELDKAYVTRKGRTEDILELIAAGV